MTKQKIQNWRGIATWVGLSAGIYLVKKAAVALKPEFERRKAQVEDYLDRKNKGIETSYQEHGFNVELPYVKSDGTLMVKYTYEDKLSGPHETLSLSGEDLETILIREKKKKVIVTQADGRNSILDRDDANAPKEIFDNVYSGANLGKYEQRWALRMALDREHPKRNK